MMKSGKGARAALGLGERKARKKARNQKSKNARGFMQLIFIVDKREKRCRHKKGREKENGMQNGRTKGRDEGNKVKWYHDGRRCIRFSA
jgi:hypothetical protein